jgi:hypothetical protein
LGKPDPPQPPNPVDTARASTSTNVATSIANAFLNNTNQNTPAGDLYYDVTGNYQWNDPYTGLNVDIPTFTASQVLSPQSQAINDQNMAAKYNLAGMANAQSSRLSQWLANNIDINGAPGAGDPNSIAGVPKAATTFGDAGQQQSTFGATPGQQSTFGDVGGNQRSIGGYGQQQTGFDNVGGPQSQFGYAPGQVFGFGEGGDITKSYGPTDNFSADRSRVEESLYGRLNPQLQKERSNIEQRLADQGIQYGSQAYTSAMDDYNRQANDARLAVTAAGGQEQQRMADMAAQRAGFQNAAQQQQFTQQQARGTFYNTAANAAFGQEQARGTFANQAQQQAYEQAAGRGAFANTAQAQNYQQALGAGTFANTAQEQAYQQALGRGTFANTAASQAFQEAQARGTFANQAQQNQFTQAAARGEFANAGLAQQVAQGQSAFNAQNMARNQFMNEQFGIRNQPINEISALLSGSQINNPNFVNTPNNQIPTTDVAGLINTRFSQDMDIYKQESQQQQALMGGIFGMMGGMMKMSDERQKEDIVKVGSVFATDVDDEKKKLPIYTYAYKQDPTKQKHIGPMAQDVERIDKGAVKTRGGIKYIQPDRVMGNVFSTAQG